MRRFTEFNVLLALTLLSVSTAAQMPKQTPVSKPQIPSQAVNEYQIKAALSVEVSPNPATVNRPARIRAIPTPDTGAWEFEFHMNSSRLTECATTSPVCDWTPKVSGEHSLIVLGRFGVPSRGGGGGGGCGGGGGLGTQTVRAVLSFGVDPEPVVTPPPPPPPTPQLGLRLISNVVIAQQPARFEVSLTNATTAEYLIKFGDGDFEPQTTTLIDHTFEKDGLATIVVRYAGVNPPLEQSLTVNVEPRPQPTPSTTPGAGVDTRRDEAPPPPPPPPPPVWPYVLVALAIVAGVWLVARAITTNSNDVQPPAPIPPPVPTFHPDLNFKPRFDPRKTGGVSLVVIYVRNLKSLRFSSTKTIRSED